MSEKILQLNEEVIKGQIKELVRGSVEETLNELLEKEQTSCATNAARLVRATATATTTETSQRLAAMLRCTCRGSRAWLLKPRSLSVTAAGKAAWKKLLLRCILPAYLCVVSRILPKPFGAARFHRPRSANSTRKPTSTIVG